MFSLCLEAQAELARSNKKVKGVNHSGFKEDICSSPTPPINGCGNQPPSASFQDKLVGEIPRAYTQVFNFVDLMEDDVEPDDKIKVLNA